jgi:hypothetical protein
MRRSIVILVLLGALTASVSSAHQGLPTPPPGVSSQLQGLFGGAVRSDAKKPSGPILPTKFKNTGKLLITDTILGSLKLDKSQEAQMRVFIPQLITAIEQAYTENGFEKNDLSVAVGGLLEICYEISSDNFVLEESEKNKSEAKKKTQAVIRQISQALGSNPSFAKIADRDRQIAYEMCTFQIGFLAVNFQQAGTDSEKKDSVKQMARQLLTSLFNIDPDGITQSKTGEIVPKPGAIKKQTEEPPVPTTQAQQTMPAASVPVATPAGWRALQGNAVGIVQFTPTNLQKDEMLFVATQQRQSLGGATIDQWITQAIARDPFGLGRQQKPPEIKAQSDNLANAVAIVSLPNGQPGSVIYLAQTVDKETVRLTAIISSTKENLLQKHQPGALQIIKSLGELDKKEAVSGGRGLDIAKLPTTYPEWLKPGGPLQPGIYVGNQIYGKEKRWSARFYLYPSGEYERFSPTGEPLEKHSSNRFKYNPRTGLLDFDWGTLFNMKNDSYDPNDDMCLFGKDAQNNLVIYARSDRGFSDATTILRYERPIDRPSPSEIKAKEAIAAAEARRYKWVTAPGKGIPTSQIHCLLLHTETTQFYNGSGMSISSTYDPYLLLKDGTIYNGLPVAPDDMDVSKSRRQEPEKWGTWKKTATGYAAAWPDFPAQYKEIKGEAVFSAPSDLKLIGRFGSGETSGSMIGSSYRLWGVTFGADGRFKKDERGGYGSNAISSSLPGAVSVNTGYDDEGSFVGASGENFALSNSTNKKPKSDRAGSYSVSGYTITLRLDNNGIVRLPFFFTDTKRQAIWFEGAVLSKDDK